MVIDTSASITILFYKSDAEYFETALEFDLTRPISTATVLETVIVVEALGKAGSRELNLLLHKARIEDVAFSSKRVEVARYAFRTYGNGRHPAKLNYGDCFSYALTPTPGETLFFAGHRFSTG